MNKIHLIVSILIVISTCSMNVLSTAQMSSLGSTILYVGGTGPGNYSSIQDAMNDAVDDNTIFVFNGTYYENIIIDKSIQLIGENKSTTIIDGSGNDDVVKITADEVQLSCFTLQNSGDDYKNDSCIEIVSNNNIISNVNCLNSTYGIWLRGCSENSIRDTFIDCEYDGIWMINSPNNILRNNSMVHCSIAIDGESLSDFIQDIDTSNTANHKPVRYYKHQKSKSISSVSGQVILVNCTDCIIHDLSIVDVTDGIGLFYSENNFIEYNTITDTKDFGIRLVKSENNIIQKNILSRNPVGIGFSSGGTWEYEIPAECHENIIYKNRISNNSLGIRLDSSNKNRLIQNDFIGNNNDVWFLNSFSNKWLKNYWDRPRFFPKLIIGQIEGLSIFHINIDWHPAKIPQSKL